MCVKKETKEVNAHKPIRQIQEHVFFFYIIYIKRAAGCHKTRFCAPPSDALQDL